MMVCRRECRGGESAAERARRKEIATRKHACQDSKQCGCRTKNHAQISKCRRRNTTYTLTDDMQKKHALSHLWQCPRATWPAPRTRSSQPPPWPVPPPFSEWTCLDRTQNNRDAGKENTGEIEAESKTQIGIHRDDCDSNQETGGMFVSSMHGTIHIRKTSTKKARRPTKREQCCRPAHLWQCRRAAAPASKRRFPSAPPSSTRGASFGDLEQWDGGSKERFHSVHSS